MKLYLVRHGDALDARIDDERPLSQRGRDEIGRLGAWCMHEGIRPGKIWHSPKTRARETAALLGESFGLRGGAIEHAGLLPEDPVSPMATILGTATDDLCLVSHLPFVDLLAGHLTGGTGQWAFATGSMLCLGRNDAGEWHAEWFSKPPR